MRAVVQRVAEARVRIEGTVVGEIGRGLCVLVGAGNGDGAHDVEYLAEKLPTLRIFPDEAGLMNRSVRDVGGALLVVSQFTLYGDCRRGRRPSFTEALAPGTAERLYEALIARLRAAGVEVATGRFRADMRVELINDGPVTLLLDSRRLF